MTEERITATATVNAPVETVFDVLADPSTHQAIDGTGWVREPLDGEPLTGPGRSSGWACTTTTIPRSTTRWPTGSRCSTRPRAIAWLPGQGPDDAGT